MQKPDVCPFLEKVLTFPTRRKGWLPHLYQEKPKGVTGRWNCQVMQTQLSWPFLFLFLWNMPGKKQEGTRKIFTESTNAPFLHAMETLYATVSEERRESPAELFQTTASLFWCQQFWGGTCTLASPKRETGTGWVSGASQVMKMDWKSLLPPSQHRFCSLLCPRVTVLCPANTHTWLASTLPRSLSSSWVLFTVWYFWAWHLLWKKSWQEKQSFFYPV